VRLALAGALAVSGSASAAPTSFKNRTAMYKVTLVKQTRPR
jgi:hypothetical protein